MKCGWAKYQLRNMAKIGDKIDYRMVDAICINPEKRVSCKKARFSWFCIAKHCKYRSIKDEGEG